MTLSLARVLGSKIRMNAVCRRLLRTGLYVKPRLSLAYPEHLKYPYPLRGLEITRANHAWAADITCIAHGKGFLSSCGNHGLGKSGGSGLAAVQHPG